MDPDAPTTLFPGYQQVEQFGPEDEYEDEEVAYVTLDLGNVEPTLVPSASNYRLIGLDTPTPFLQLQGTVLKGRHHRLLGTEIVFTDDKDVQKRTMQHIANTEQRILFKEVTLQPKSPVDSPTRTTKPSDATEASKSLDSGAAQAVVVLEDGQRIDRMTGKTAPAPRASRTKGAVKRKANVADDNETESGKGKERVEHNADSEPILPPPETDMSMDTT